MRTDPADRHWLHAYNVDGRGWCIVDTRDNAVLSHAVPCFDRVVFLPVLWQDFTLIDRFIQDGDITVVDPSLEAVGFRGGLSARTTKITLPRSPVDESNV